MPAGKYKNKAYPLRIDESTLLTVKAIAEENKISANKQIEMILDDYIKEKKIKREIAKTLINIQKEIK